ncbi:MAG TPA: MAB_1171c family putative transporter [Actinophytocola sp.]|uniref:MAB_1171c family putative transporter n=1 Tax=Actinophytocola sp. TaxID=1872138 RepID=UPI002DDC988B|nr:MAB_1171c family putative transporter [Actinophytocola sp.]HEV2781137.1 MAB_1171c family putative transporter [Actinophytocola sp.]
MTTLGVFEGIASHLVLALMIYLLIRAPRNPALLAITVTIASFALTFAFRLALLDGAGFLGLEPIMSRLVQQFIMLLGGYGLVTFFLFSALDVREARRRAMWQAVPVVLAVLVMTHAIAAMPPHIRDSAALLTSRSGGPVGEPTIALMYLSVYVYQAYAYITALVLTRRYARGAEPRLRRGLALATAGLAAMVPAQMIFVGAAAGRWAAVTMPRTITFTGIFMMLGGIVVFLVGFAYPAVGMRLAALRVWWQHRRMYRRLGPLWTLLHREFPEDALCRVPTSPWRDAVSLRGVHRRYYRRVIECRDGLVRISPYLGPNGDRSLADRLREGVAAHASGASAPARAMPVAIPAGDGLDADVHELVALSDALRSGETGPRPDGGQKESGSVLDRPGGHREHGTAADYTHTDR